MRFKFFLATFSVLCFVVCLSMGVHFILLKQEREQLIDEQIRQTAEGLIDSNLGDLRFIDFEKSESIISEELGESRIGKFFVIRNAQNEIIFRSAGAKVLPVEHFTRTAQWATLKFKDQFIRILNLQLPRFPDRFLQVGYVLNDNIVNPSFFSFFSVLFLIGTLTIGLVSSWLLTSHLMKPIAHLAGFLDQIDKKTKAQAFLPPIPTELLSPKKINRETRDEFIQMLTGLNTLITKVNRNYRLSRLWAYQMAHELKTPLAILTLELEKMQKDSGDSATVKSMQLEAKKISESINSFLGWAELENSSKQNYLFANKVSYVLTDLVNRLAGRFPDRLILDVRNDFVVLANPQQFEQFLVNLISNAATYSSQSVTISAYDRKIVISDSGPGISRAVLERMGEPFNRGEAIESKRSGHGLGLAWVATIARLYSWDLNVESSSSGTRFAIDFVEHGVDDVQTQNFAGKVQTAET